MRGTQEAGQRGSAPERIQPCHLKKPWRSEGVGGGVWVCGCVGGGGRGGGGGGKGGGRVRVPSSPAYLPLSLFPSLSHPPSLPLSLCGSTTLFFFPLSATIFALFVSLSGCFLDEFWWFCETPAAFPPHGGRGKKEREIPGPTLRGPFFQVWGPTLRGHELLCFFFFSSLFCLKEGKKTETPIWAKVGLAKVGLSKAWLEPLVFPISFEHS